MFRECKFISGKMAEERKEGWKEVKDKGIRKGRTRRLPLTWCHTVEGLGQGGCVARAGEGRAPRHRAAGKGWFYDALSPP